MKSYKPSLCGALGVVAALLCPALALAEPNSVITVPLVSGGNNGASFRVSFDRNGRYAVFSSEAQNLVPDQNTAGHSNVFLYDRIAGTVRLVSHFPFAPAVGGNGDVNPGNAPQISADGKWVVYCSTATDLIVGQNDANAGFDVFLWSRESDTTTLVSRQANSGTIAGNAASSTVGRLVTLSNDGRFVVFLSNATDLVLAQTANAFAQVYQFDRSSGSNVLVSHASSSVLASANNRSDFSPQQDGRAISADGRFAVFKTLASNLAPGISDSNGNFDVYLWDRDAALAGSLKLLSRRGSNPSATGSGLSENGVISADGKFVALVSGAADLEGVTADTNSSRDVFRYDRENDLLELVSHNSSGATSTANGVSNFPTIGAGGDPIAYQSSATNLVAQQDDTNGSDDVFLWRDGQNVLVSHAAGSASTAGNGASRRVVVGPDGGVGFSSLATNLVNGAFDTNGASDSYYRPRLGGAPILVSHVPDETATGNSGSETAQILLDGALVAFESFAQNLVDGPINASPNLLHHGGLIMADGFESGDFAAWSQVLP